MGNKNKKRTKKSQSAVDNRIIDLKRFAYDVITYSALKFEVDKNCLQGFEGEKNDYGSSDFILVLSRIFFKYQITGRNLLYRSFKSRYNLNKFQSFEDICQILRQVLNIFIKKARGCVLHEVIISLSVINEMIIFLYSENCPLLLEKMTRFWYEYLSHMKQNFEKAGGFSKLYEMYNMPKYDTLDAFYDEFIAGFCIPYNNPEALDCLDEIFHAESHSYFENLSKDLPENEKFEYKIIMYDTLWRESVQFVVSKEREKEDNMALEARKQDETSTGPDNLENTDLGIPQHELLCAGGVQEVAGTFTNLPGPSSQEPLRRYKRLSSQEKKQKCKSTLRSSIEKDFEKLNLDSSESKDSTLKKK